MKSSRLVFCTRMRAFIFFSALVIVFMFFFGCSREKENPVAPAPSSVSVIPVKEINGEVSLPDNSPVKNNELEVIGATGTVLTSTEGAFTIKVPDGFYSFLYVYNNGKLIAAVYDTLGSNVEINETTTAIAIVMMFPIDWRKLNITTVNELVNKIRNAPSFVNLVKYVRNIMNNDPENLMNYQLHPSILETAAAVVNEVINANKNNILFETMGGARIEDVKDNPDIKVINPKAIPYGICVYNADGDPSDGSSYSFLTSPLYVNGWDFDWWIIPRPGEVHYNLGDGNYIIMLSKMDPCWFAPFIGMYSTFKTIMDNIESLYSGDYMELLKANARLKGALGGVLTVSYRSLGIVSAADPTELTGMGKVVLEFGPSAVELFTDMTLAGEKPESVSKLSVMKWAAKIVAIDKNSNMISKFLQKHGAEITAKSLKAAAENLTIILDVIGAIEDAGLLVAFVWDLKYADQDVCYQITQIAGNIIEANKSSPPTAPVITNAPKQLVVGQECNIAVTSTDPDDDKVKYYLCFGDGTVAESPLLNSGETYVFSHSWSIEGVFEVYAYTVDENGISSSYSEILNIRVYTSGGFYDNFDSYAIGSVEEFGPWYSEYLLPSRVLIVETGDDLLGKSCKFIDYDEDIGDVEGYYAYIVADVTGNPSEVELMLRVEESGDAFGVRAWHDFGIWSTISYYILINNNKLKWVKYGLDEGDPSDFIPVMDVIPKRWYTIKLIIDWNEMKYDLYVDNLLKASGCTFIGDVNYANYFQAVAFTETQCHAAYIDEIKMAGGSIVVRRFGLNNANIKGASGIVRP